MADRRSLGEGGQPDASVGSCAFRMFKDAVRRLGIEQAWFDFREAAFEDIAKDWLEAHGIPYA